MGIDVDARANGPGACALAATSLPVAHNVVHTIGNMSRTNLFSDRRGPVVIVHLAMRSGGARLAGRGEADDLLVAAQFVDSQKRLAIVRAGGLRGVDLTGVSSGFGRPKVFAWTRL